MTHCATVQLKSRQISTRFCTSLEISPPIHNSENLSVQSHFKIKSSLVSFCHSCEKYFVSEQVWSYSATVINDVFGAKNALFTDKFNEVSLLNIPALSEVGCQTLSKIGQ